MPDVGCEATQSRKLKATEASLPYFNPSKKGHIQDLNYLKIKLGLNHSLLLKGWEIATSTVGKISSGRIHLPP